MELQGLWAVPSGSPVWRALERRRRGRVLCPQKMVPKESCCHRHVNNIMCSAAGRSGLLGDEGVQEAEIELYASEDHDQS